MLQNMMISLLTLQLSNLVWIDNKYLYRLIVIFIDYR